MRVILCLCLMFCYSLAQERFVQYDAATMAKSARCNTFDYVLVSRNVNGIQTPFVDRSAFVRKLRPNDPVEAGRVMNCSTGTLMSLSPDLCACDVLIAVSQISNTDRCSQFRGDFQNDLRLFTQMRRLNGAMVQNRGYIESSSLNLFDANLQCLYTNQDSYYSIPFYAGNNIARTGMSFTIGFRVPSSAPNGAYRLATNGPCGVQTDVPSFLVTYVKLGTAGDVVINLRAARIGFEGVLASEVDVSITCNIVPYNRVAPSVASIFNPEDASNRLTVSFTNNDLRTAQIILRSGALSDTEAASGGFCSVSTLGLNALRGSFVLASRNCPLMIGLAPDQGRVCVSQLALDNDC